MPLVNWIRIFLDVYFLKFMATNDIRKHLIAAEEELRLAFVESLENRYDDNLSMLVAVSYTHLTLPTILRV